MKIICKQYKLSFCLQGVSLSALYLGGHAEKLNLEHHYSSEAMQVKLRELPLEVDLNDKQDEDEDCRYVSALK